MKNPVFAYLPTIAGVSAGTLAAVVVSFAFLQPQLNSLHQELADLRQSTSTLVAIPSTPLTPPIEIIPIERRPLVPTYPSAFLDRRVSSVVTLVRRGKNDSLPISEEREIGGAVALTTDGWLATSRSTVEGLRLADLGVEWSGRMFPVRRAFRDTATDIVYLKIDATNLPTVAFSRASDVQSGAAVWFESRPGQLRADLIVDASVMSTRDPLSSERAGRRFLIQGMPGNTAGGAVWDGGGKLVGIIEADGASGLTVLPAEGLGSTLAQLVGSGEILRPLLGIRGVDLAEVTLDTASSSLPSLGMWVRGVTVGTPAYRNLVENDVIERVERDILDGNADLGERLLDYRPGATLTFYGRRAGESFQARVTIGSHNTAEAIK